MSSNLPASTTPRDASIISQYTPDEYERTSYYNGISGDGDHPELVYRSDFLTTPFPKPEGRFAHVPVKSLRGVFNSPLSAVWLTVAPQISGLIKARDIKWSSIDVARFFTHGPPGEEDAGRLGPVVIWIGVIPGSTSADIAHGVSQDILALLSKNGVEGVVVEWREAVCQRLAGPPLMRHAGSVNATHHVRRFLIPRVGIPLSAAATEKQDSEGTLTLWFHENKDKDGNPSDKVYGVSNCHVLRNNTTVKYEHIDGARKDPVRIYGVHRFQRGLDEIKETIADCRIRAELQAGEIILAEAKEGQGAEYAKKIRVSQSKLEDEHKAIADLAALYTDIAQHWSDMDLQRTIGYVQYAGPITTDVEGGTLYTSDWAAFVAAESKIKDEFEGNVVDLGSKFTPAELTRAVGGSARAFEFPVGRKLRIEGCATNEDLAHPTTIDADGQHCLIVGKDGNTTDLTVGHYAGLVSLTRSEAGVESVELGIYNSGVTTAKMEPFSARGDSGALVWCVKDGKVCIFGQLHSGGSKGSGTSNHVSYCTPGWFLLEQIRRRFEYAEFYRTTWSA